MDDEEQQFLDTLPDKSFLSTLPDKPKDDTKSSEGYWEDKGIAGKVWHPAVKATSELGRKDTVMFDMPMSGMYDKISNLAGKYLPQKLQFAGGALGSLAAYPLEVLKDIAAQPESPAIGAVAGIKSLAKTGNLKQRLESIPQQK